MTTSAAAPPPRRTTVSPPLVRDDAAIEYRRTTHSPGNATTGAACGTPGWMSRTPLSSIEGRSTSDRKKDASKATDGRAVGDRASGASGAKNR
ncbi:hypothetical protein DIPPA_17237 [Diplonema papillatum]|nr:hypothetical protein DIPPA_17237 [Diplonema papillatum]